MHNHRRSRVDKWSNLQICLHFIKESQYNYRKTSSIRLIARNKEPLDLEFRLPAGGPLGSVNTLRPRQYGRHFADDILKFIFLNENVWIPIEISLKIVPKGPIDNIPALV